jgi:solute carrier family 39 (zinc transporter), member 1/2/3
MMEVTTAKAVSMLTLGLGSFIAGVIPACFSEGTRQRHPLVISCLLCFGGGVLFSTSLVHMLPEAKENFKYAELMFCVGFFLVYLVDELVHLFYGPGNDPHHRAQRYGASEGTSLLQPERQRNDDAEMLDRCCGDTNNPRMCHVSHTAPCNKSSSGVIGLLCALFVHSLLEGLAIGLQEDASQVSYFNFIQMKIVFITL